MYLVTHSYPTFTNMQFMHTWLPHAHHITSHSTETHRTHTHTHLIQLLQPYSAVQPQTFLSHLHTCLQTHSVHTLAHISLCGSCAWKEETEWGRSVSSEKRELSAEPLTLSRLVLRFGSLHSALQNRMKQQHLSLGNDSLKPTLPWSQFTFFTRSMFWIRSMLLNHTEEGFPPPVRASMETRCAVKGKERVHKSRGAVGQQGGEEGED